MSEPRKDDDTTGLDISEAADFNIDGADIRGSFGVGVRARDARGGTLRNVSVRGSGTGLKIETTGRRRPDSPPKERRLFAVGDQAWKERAAAKKAERDRLLSQPEPSRVVDGH